MHYAARPLLFAASAALALSASVSAQIATAFTYQGQLTTPAGAAVNRCDVLFRLYAAETDGSPLGPQLCFDDLIVTHGVFSAQLDFGDQFTGTPRFIEIAVRPNSALDCSNATGFTTLAGRQPVAPTPHAIFATATRGLTVDAAGKVGVGPGMSTPQYSVDIRGLTPPADAAGGPVYIAAGVGAAGAGGGAGGGSLLLGGGGAFNSFGGSPGGGVTLAAGGGALGFTGSTSATGGTVLLVAGGGGAVGPFGGFAGAGGDIVLRPGAGGSLGGFGNGASGVALVDGNLVVDAQGAGSSIQIGGRDTAAGGKAVLKLGTSADSAGECIIQGISAAGSDYGILVLNPQGGVVAKPGGGSFAVYCDQRLKHDLVPMSGTLERLLSLRGYSYQYTDNAVAQRHALPGVQIGLLAQDVRRVFPDWVNTDAEGFLMVTERSTTALMVESLRDLRAEKDAQLAQRDARLQVLEHENADLKSRPERIERAIAK